MSKFNTPTLRHARGSGVVTGPTAPAGTTFQGGAGFGRDPKGELFLLGVAHFVGEDTFYESGTDRDDRFVELVRTVAVLDPRWTYEFLTWLRVGANIRTAAVVGGIEAARALAAIPTPTWDRALPPLSPRPRAFVATVLQRADEPGEALAYWYARYGRTLPKWLKRGLGDAALRLYTPYAYAKWDSARSAVRFADVIEVSQIRRAAGDESGLFTHILDARPGARRAPRTADTAGIPLLAARAELMKLPVSARLATLNDPAAAVTFRTAGLTWEAISGWLQGAMDAPVWERIIDLGLMPYGALLRNLANFDRAGISATARRAVIDRLTDPAAVARSRLLPMAFLNAYVNVPGDTYKPALDEAATHSLGNITGFPGRSLVLIDTSGSMNSPFTTRTPGARRRADAIQLMRWDAAALFGIALGRACANADVVSFSESYFGQAGRNGSLAFEPRRGENLLAAVNRFRSTCFINGGTDTAAAVKRWYAGHDRVFCLTDEQANHNPAGVYAAVPDTVPVYTFNLAGYRYGHAASTVNRFTVGGLSDAGFGMITAIESYAAGRWPWQQ